MSEGYLRRLVVRAAGRHQGIELAAALPPDFGPHVASTTEEWGETVEERVMTPQLSRSVDKRTRSIGAPSNGVLAAPERAGPTDAAAYRTSAPNKSPAEAPPRHESSIPAAASEASISVDVSGVSPRPGLKVARPGNLLAASQPVAEQLGKTQLPPPVGEHFSELADAAPTPTHAASPSSLRSTTGLATPRTRAAPILGPTVREPTPSSTQYLSKLAPGDDASTRLHDERPAASVLVTRMESPREEGTPSPRAPGGRNQPSEDARGVRSPHSVQVTIDSIEVKLPGPTPAPQQAEPPRQPVGFDRYESIRSYRSRGG